MRKLLIISLLGAIIFIFAFTPFKAEEPIYISPSPQRTGDAGKGYEYLINGDYVKSGLPLSLFKMGVGKDKNDPLHRKGINEAIPFQYTAVKADNGEIVVAPNCMQCHAQMVDGQLIMGLGNAKADFSDDRISVSNLEMAEKFLKSLHPKQYEASKAFLNATKTVTPHLHTSIRGVNAADRLAAVLVAHRDPSNFTWSDSAMLQIPSELIPSDVPAWWLLKKKNAMFYNGFGRGDFGRFLMASNLLTTNDTAESREVDAHMPDVLSYIYSLEPPKFKGSINTSLASSGEKIFLQNCSGCHGTYGEHSTYPNLLIPQSIIGTDSALYMSNYSNPQFVNWFNSSWFTQGDHPARLVPAHGYVAPPLDGIWVTAPYLHNGSVPTLAAVLNSRIRPGYWLRNFDSDEYDETHMGWTYLSSDQPKAKYYNTAVKGYGNYGHTFGDHLSDSERKAVLEYLKTL